MKILSSAVQRPLHIANYRYFMWWTEVKTAAGVNDFDVFQNFSSGWIGRRRCIRKSSER